jgi:hypothetical protein
MQDQHVLDNKPGYVFIWRIFCQIALVSGHSVEDSFALYAVRLLSGHKLKEDGAGASRKLAGVTGPFSMRMRKDDFPSDVDDPEDRDSASSCHLLA